MKLGKMLLVLIKKKSVLTKCPKLMIVTFILISGMRIICVTLSATRKF